MGKPYCSEIALLGNTYKWAMQCEIIKLVSITHRLSLHSLIAIGSGGSYTVASFHSWLHERVTGKPSYAITPYQTVSHKNVFRNTAVAIFSAEGKNKDILGTLNVAMAAEPKELVVFALKTDAPLVDLADKSHWVSSVAFDMPWEKDGYLATNSLFASCVILYRAYQQVFPHVFEPLPSTLDELIAVSVPSFTSELQAYAKNSNAPHDSLLVIFGESGRVASIDIESKMAESVLANALIADFRNFAHGRHLWADRNKNKAATLVIWSEDDRLLYENYSKSIPQSIPQLSMYLSGPSGWQSLASLWAVLKLVETLGDLNHIDPGEPLVPDFGRAFYHMDAFQAPHDMINIARAETAVVRKYGSDEGFSDERMKVMEAGSEEFKTILGNTHFSYLVLDYDATLCSSDNRFTGLTKEIYQPLIRLLEHGIMLGIATGRGPSVQKDFKKVIPEELWDRIWVGLYNCSTILALNDEYLKEKQPKDPEILGLYEFLAQNGYIKSIFKLELRPTQLTLSTINPTACEIAWRVINEILAAPEYAQLKAVRSTHSWDVINRKTSKVNLVNHLEADGGKCLCIGDRGLWPGNDYELLGTPYSLGVDEISPLHQNCWNISPAGTKGIAATAFYLSRLQVNDGQFSFAI